MTFMEILVPPKLRGQEIGKKIFADFIMESEKIISRSVNAGKAVFFPDNRSSRKIFESAGFALDSVSEKGDAMYHKFRRAAISSN